ncbi:response regulator [Malaciobacter mytili]|uniref:Two-component system response regulator n=1 Tax=Malaciobacter mytili LMG 24559 TaxID=1032238 RepID=A0AAX2AI24_9BACT|nr:response regulator [Malaciobacter mytili]AXH14148.1 signal transduction response regulator [Malaciobacter mytili LMG 24559]RXK15161.1 two-component system response regulator [Malaciobacter mytili LMG 24559]
MQEKIVELRKLKLLFVEDEDDLINIITDTLTKLQANFLTAQNGQDALKIVEENPDIDAVITDINMPIMNGLEMIKILKEKNPSIPVVIMSAHTEIEYIDKAKEFGVENYLLKPFDFIKFIELITTMEIKKHGI